PIRPIASAKAGGSRRGSMSLWKVTWQSALLATIRLWYSSPLPRATPVTAPPWTRIWRTSAPVRTSAPWARATRASACVRPPGPQHVGRPLDQGRLEHVGDALQHGLVLGVLLGVAGAELADLPVRQLAVAAHQQIPAIGEGGEGGGHALEQLEAVVVQFQVVD